MSKCSVVLHTKEIHSLIESTNKEDVEDGSQVGTSDGVRNATRSGAQVKNSFGVQRQHCDSKVGRFLCDNVGEIETDYVSLASDDGDPKCGCLIDSIDKNDIGWETVKRKRNKR